MAAHAGWRGFATASAVRDCLCGLQGGRRSGRCPCGRGDEGERCGKQHALGSDHDFKRSMQTG